MSVTPTPQTIEGISAVAHRYRGVILDLWGVIHNGEATFPHAIAALDELHRRGVGICLLSNSPRRAEEVASRLSAMGVESSRYQHLITSGELVFGTLGGPVRDSGSPLGRNFLHIGPQELAGLLWGLDRQEVTSPSEADFVLATGMDDRQTAASLIELLQKCASLKLPMVCANPDLVVLVGAQMIECAGTLAAAYKAMGGAVQYYGKPHPAVYQHALDRLGHEKHQVLAVGDALRTDVAGARNNGLDVVFIASGIHRGDLDGDPASNVWSSRLQDMSIALGSTPTFAAPYFKW